MGVRNYRDLVAWQKGMAMVEAIYRATATFPKEEIYTLTNQMRRAAISVPCNIAEGQGRTSIKDFLHFLSIARGSLRELETQVLLAHRLGYLDLPCQDMLMEMADEVGRLITGLANSLKRQIS